MMLPSRIRASAESSPAQGVRVCPVCIPKARKLPALLGSAARDVRLTTGVKLRGPEGAQRLRATSASTAELYRSASLGAKTSDRPAKELTLCASGSFDA